MCPRRPAPGQGAGEVACLPEAGGPGDDHVAGASQEAKLAELQRTTPRSRPRGLRKSTSSTDASIFSWAALVRLARRPSSRAAHWRSTAPEALGEGELGVTRALHLLGERLGHRPQPQVVEALGRQRVVHWLHPFVVVGGAAHVCVRDHRWGDVVVQKPVVEATFEDRAHGAVGGGAIRKRPGAGRLEALGSVAITETQHAEAAAKAELGVRAGRHDRPAERGRLGPVLAAQPAMALGRPGGHGAMLLGHVLGQGGRPAAGVASCVHGDAYALVVTSTVRASKRSSTFSRTRW